MDSIGLLSLVDLSEMLLLSVHSPSEAHVARSATSRAKEVPKKKTITLHQSLSIGPPKILQLNCDVV